MNRLVANSLLVRGVWTLLAVSATPAVAQSDNLPVLDFHWSSPLAIDDRLTDKLQQVGLASGGLDFPPAPVIAKDLVICRAVGRFIAFNRRTGKRVWEFPWSMPSTMPSTETTEQDRAWSFRFGQLFSVASSDGKFVFLVEGPLRKPRPAVVVGTNVLFPSPDSLTALSVAKDGALVWRVGGRGNDEPKLEAAKPLGPAVGSGELALALFERKAMIEFVALRAESGELVFSIPLFDANPRSDTVVAALAPVHLGGSRWLAVGPLGVIAIVDIGGRNTVWVRERGPNSTPVSEAEARVVDDMLVVQMGGRINTTQRVPGSPLAIGTASSALRGYKMKDGELAWSHLKRTGSWFAGVRSGVAVTVQPTNVIFYRVDSGEVAANIDLPAAVSGRGAWIDDRLMLPLTSGEILEIDCTLRRIVARTPTRVELGNLTHMDGEIYSLSPTRACAIRTRRLVKQLLEAARDESTQLRYRAELLASDGEFLQAAETVLKLGPQHSVTRMRMSHYLFGELDSGSAPAATVEALYDRADIPEKADRDVRLRLAHRKLEEGRAAEAFQWFMALVDDDAPDQFVDFGGRRILLSRSVSTGIARCIKQLSPDERTRLLKSIPQPTVDR
ncbi:MAG: PQQ-binding-like beta-propeller repeat protein [Pirellulaceae bacterium]|nr:PQQ-binding-like beta-propeller repeat protein [Pirellulaceae bacterium]